MTLEYELGKLIRTRNPYTNGKRGTMRFFPVGAGVVSPAAAAARAAANDAVAKVAAAAAAAASAGRAAAAARAAAGDHAVAAPDAADAAALSLARALAAHDAAIRAMEDAADAADPIVDLSHIDIGEDNDYTQEYMTWIFKGRPQKVKRALRVRYRYELMNNGQGTGLYATEHLLIGYAGSNG
jgi:glycine/D-amino acid oxidase-like deaminating enzyme